MEMNGTLFEGVLGCRVTGSFDGTGAQMIGRIVAVWLDRTHDDAADFAVRVTVAVDEVTFADGQIAESFVFSDAWLSNLRRVR